MVCFLFLCHIIIFWYCTCLILPQLDFKQLQLRQYILI